MIDNPEQTCYHPPMTKRILITQFPKGQDQGRNEFRAIVELPFEETKMLVPFKKGCCTPSLIERPVGLIKLGTHTFVVYLDNDWDRAKQEDADFEIALHGDFVLPKIVMSFAADSKYDVCPTCHRPNLP